MSDDQTAPIPVTLCLACGYAMNRAGRLAGEAQPRPGDFTICIDCGALAMFDADLHLVPVPPGELEALDPESRHELLETQRCVQAAKAATTWRGLPIPPRQH